MRPTSRPPGSASYSDGELVRAVTTGVARDGRAMFPLMPYTNYGQLASDDIQAMLAYVRTLSRIDHQVPARSLDFPMNLIVNIIPTAATPGVRPSPDGSRRLWQVPGDGRQLRRVPHED